MPEQSFDADVKPLEDRNGDYGFLVPFDVYEVFGEKELVKVKGTIDGYAYRSAIFPIGNGTHYMVVNEEMRNAIDKPNGGIVAMTMDMDIAERLVDIPDDLQTLLDGNDTARSFFERLAYSHQKEYVDWIDAAEKPEARIHRLEQAVQMLVQGKTVQ